MIEHEPRHPVALEAGEGEALWCAGALSVVKASAAQTGGVYALIEDLAPKGSGPPPHRHPDDDEAFYVLEGEVTFFIGGETVGAGAGAFVHIPGGAVHGFRVESPTARYLIVTTPQHEAFYRAIAEPAKERRIPPESAMDMDQIAAACRQFGVEGVGAEPAER